VGRYFLEISYNGANYSGWQKQQNSNSVQAVLEETGRHIFRQDLLIAGSSRTDAGVHALGQIAQMDLDDDSALEERRFRWNMALPADIAVRSIRAVRPDAQCRHEAQFRRYIYAISRTKSPFATGRTMYWYGKLDVAAMQACANLLLQYQDFEAFSKVHTQVKHFECRIEKADWKTEEDYLFFEIQANRFLRGMVRGLVGTMMEVGKGQKTVFDFQEILEQKDRRKAGENAPACGLFLVEVGYPAEMYLDSLPPISGETKLSLFPDRFGSASRTGLV
jgi:tRNA pseudouridine38-40 synthase